MDTCWPGSAYSQAWRAKVRFGEGAEQNGEGQNGAGGGEEWACPWAAWPGEEMDIESSHWDDPNPQPQPGQP